MQTLQTLSSPTRPEMCDTCDIFSNNILLHKVMDCIDTIDTRDVLMNDITNKFNVELYIYMDNCTPEQLLSTLLGRRLPANIITDADDKIKFHKLCTTFI